MSKTAIVTGAAKGIGAEIVKMLCQNSYNVVANYKSSESQAKLLKEQLTGLGQSMEIFRANVSEYAQAEKLIDFTLDCFGSIDVLVNNAGIAQQILFNDMTEKCWDDMMDSNLKTVFNCTRCVIPHMLRKHDGNIVNISSIWGIVGASCEVHYSASKAAIIGFTKALAKETAPNGVRVNCVAPGIIKTDMLDSFSESELNDLKYDTPLMRLGTSKDIANAVEFLISDKASFITGQIISPNGGFVI